MFYKRISDLHPLGKKIGDWEGIEPVPIPNPGHHFQTTDDSHTTTVNSIGELQKVSPSSDTGLTGLDNAFNNDSGQVWYSHDTESYNYRTSRFSQDEYDINSKQLKSEYYAKSLWFEVGVTKAANSERPTSYPQSIDRYQSKRVNAYLLFTNIDEISANEISADLISARTIICQEVSSQVVTANVINTNIIYADYGDISSLNVTSITASGISSYVGVVQEISGNNLFYHNAKFDNISVSGVAELTAEAAYWADVAEIYTADKGYLYGTLVKFGGEKEITLANDKANAVVSEKPAITLNSGNRNENATPIVLTGRSKVRTIHPVKKFDKIYLSETPGVGSISSYKISSATMPIGIALEDKPYDEEGLIECILQLNFE